MATNTFLTIDMITREALRVLENNLTIGKFINRSYDSEFAISGAKIGDTLRIRKPAQFIGRSGAAISVEDYVEQYTTLTLSKQIGVDMEVNSKDFTLKLDDFSERVLKPQVANIANRTDGSVADLYSGVFNSVVGTGTLNDFIDANVLLDNNACPRSDRSAVVSPAVQAALIKDTKGLFNSTTEIARQYKEGTMGMTIGNKFSMDQNIAVHTVGSAQANTITVNGASQTGSTITVAGLVGTLNKGDILTFAGVFSVNPVSKTSTGKLAQFVVTATTTGGTTIPVYPAIVITGATQTVTGSPANSAAVTVQGVAGSVYSESLVFDKNAFTLASADLNLPGGVDKAARISDDQLGISIRMVRQYDVQTDKFFSRLDFLFGVSILRPEHACRVRVLA